MLSVPIQRTKEKEVAINVLISVLRTFLIKNFSSTYISIIYYSNISDIQLVGYRVPKYNIRSRVSHFSCKFS